MYQLLNCQEIQSQSWQDRDVNQIYKKIEQVGQGTYGKVFKAQKLEQAEQADYFALKQLIPSDTEDIQKYYKLQLREIQILEQLDHKNIIKLHQVVTAKQSELSVKSSIILVFDYIEHDIFGLFQNRVTFQDAQIKCIMHQLLCGLEYLHSKNIVHRDIKSANILYSNNGRIKIGDFGLSDFISNQQSTHKVGTLCYRAPEILLGIQSYTTKIDLWSAGCMMAEFFINRILFYSIFYVFTLFNIKIER